MKPGKRWLVAALAAAMLATGVYTGAAIAAGSAGHNPNSWPSLFSRHVTRSAALAPDITTAATIVAISRGGHAQFIDLPPDGPSQGDRVVVHTPLFNRAGTQVGDLNVEETVTKLSGRGQEQAVATARLFGRGQITFQGEDTNQATIIGGVTGGTGNFQNARGQVAVTFREHSVLLAFHLLP